VIYLTFDDGPIPEVTEFVLDQLRDNNAKATFFCVGDNIKKHPEVYNRLLKEGHRSGNHTFNHLNGITVPTKEYVKNVEWCSSVIRDRFEGKELFRPPYGRLTSKQVWLLKDHYEVVMWSVLSGDFDQALSKEECLAKSIQYSENGTIIVFHDSVKTIDKLKWVLPRYLAHFNQLGFRFACL